jgi:hypothetical protein
MGSARSSTILLATSEWDKAVKQENIKEHKRPIDKDMDDGDTFVKEATTVPTNQTSLSVMQTTSKLRPLVTYAKACQ